MKNNTDLGGCSDGRITPSNSLIIIIIIVIILFIKTHCSNIQNG